MSLNSLNFSWIIYQKQYRICHQESCCLMYHLVSLIRNHLAQGCGTQEVECFLFSAPAFTLPSTCLTNGSCLREAKQVGTTWDGWGWRSVPVWWKTAIGQSWKGVVRTWSKSPSLDRTILRKNILSAENLQTDSSTSSSKLTAQLLGTILSLKGVRASAWRSLCSRSCQR